jgi:hypothetical protein
MPLQSGKRKRLDMTTALFVVPTFTDDDGVLLATHIARDCGCTITSCVESTKYDAFNMVLAGTDDAIWAFASDIDLDPKTVDGVRYVAPPTCPRCGRPL